MTVVNIADGSTSVPVNQRSEARRDDDHSQSESADLGEKTSFEQIKMERMLQEQKTKIKLLNLILGVVFTFCYTVYYIIIAQSI